MKLKKLQCCLTKLGSTYNSTLQRLHNWYSLRKSKSNTKKQKRAELKEQMKIDKYNNSVNFVMSVSGDSSHVVVHHNKCYRVTILNNSIDVEDHKGEAVNEPSLLIEILKEVKENGTYR